MRRLGSVFAAAALCWLAAPQSRVIAAQFEDAIAPVPAGASAADPSPVQGPSGSPVTLDSLLDGAIIDVPETPLPDGLICFGNEPFWSLTFESAGTATYNEPDLAAPQIYQVVEALTARGRIEYPVSLDLNAGLSTGLAIVDHQACSDGMSDVTHLYSVHLLLKNQNGRKLLTGCCRKP